MQLFAEPTIQSITLDSLLGTPASSEMHPTIFQPRIIGTAKDNSGIVATNRLTTTDASPTLFPVTQLGDRQSAFITANVDLQAPALNQHAGFVRAATYRNIGGVLSLVGSIQDIYTQRDNAGWDVDFVASINVIYLRLVPVLDNTILWSFSIEITFS